MWGAAGAPQRGEAIRETVRTWKRRCGMWDIIRRPSVWCVRTLLREKFYPPPTPSLLTPWPGNWPANRPKTRKNTCKSTCCSSECAQNTNPGGCTPFSPSRLRPPKVRTLCSKWQLKRPKYEPFAENGSWSALSTNPLLKVRQKCEPFAQNGSYSTQSSNPLLKMAITGRAGLALNRSKSEPFAQNASRSAQSLNPLPECEQERINCLKSSGCEPFA